MYEFSVCRTAGNKPASLSDLLARNSLQQNVYRVRGIDSISASIPFRLVLLALAMLCFPVGMRGAVAPELSAVSCSSSSITGSATDTCTVTLTAAAGSGGLAVQLASTDTSFKVPASLVVPASASSARFAATVTWVETAQVATVVARQGIVTKSFAVKLNPEIPILKLSAIKFNFGSVVVNNTSTPQYLTLTSAGNAPVKIDSVAIAGAGFTVSQASLPITLNPGQTVKGELLFHPERAGAAAGLLTITSTSSAAPKAVISMSGTGTPELTGLSCANPAVSGSTTDVCTVSLNAAAATGGFAVALSSSDASFKVPTAVIVPANVSSAKFTATTNWVETAQTATITAKAGTVTKALAVKLNAETPVLKLSAASVAFGSVIVDNSAAPQYVTLTSSGTAPVTIRSAVLNGAGYSVSGATLPATLNPGQLVRLELLFHPTHSGATAGEVTITSTSLAAPKTVISMSGTGTPELTGISCAAATITGSATDVCTVTLNAAAATGGFAVSLSSNDGSFKVPASVTVPANASSAKFTATATYVTSAQTATVTAKAGSLSKAYSVKLNASIPELKFSAAGIAFGNISINSPSTRSLTLTSSGTEPLKISGETLTGTGFSLSGNTGAITLNPGQTATINVQFDPKTIGAATGLLTIASNSPTNPKEVISLSGTGVAPAALLDLACNVGTVTQPITDPCAVSLTAPAPAGGIVVNLSSSNAAVKVPATVIVSAGTSQAVFDATTTGVSSPQTATLTAKSGTVSKTLALRLDAVTPTLHVSTPSVAFGNVTVNATGAAQSVTLTSTGTAPVTVSADTLTGAGFTASGISMPVTLNPGQSATLNLQFHPTVSGAVTGQLTFTSNSSTNPSTAVTLSGTGVPALTGLTCSSTSITGSGTDSCLVSLNAAPSGTGLTVSLSSADPAVKVPSTVTIPANATSAGFNATVSAVTSAQTATLSATAGSVSKTFALQLSASVPTLTVSAGSLAFGSVTVNTAATPQTVTLKSTGTVPVTVNSAVITGSGFSLSGGTFPITLNPGQSAAVTVQFDPTATGAATGQLTINSTSSTTPSAVVSLSGTGAAVAGSLSALSCTSASLTGSGSDACTVSLTAPAASGGVTVALSSSSSAVVVPATVTVPANATSAGFTATVSAVTSAQTATLSATAGSVSKTFALQLSASVPTLSLNSTSISFGSVNLNSPSTQPVVLTSTGTAAVTVNSVTVSGTGFTITGATFPATLNPGQSLTLNVEFDPTTSGAATGQLSISSTSSTNGAVVVSLSGTGISPSYSVNLSWNAPSSTPVAIAGYNIYRALSGSSSYQLLNASVDAQTTYVDTTVQNGQTYQYYVESVDSAGGTSAPSNTFNVAVP